MIRRTVACGVLAASLAATGVAQQLSWAKQILAIGDGGSAVMVAADLPEGRSAIAGYLFGRTLVFGGGETNETTLTVLHTSDPYGSSAPWAYWGETGAFVASYEADGSLRWARPIEAIAQLVGGLFDGQSPMDLVHPTGLAGASDGSLVLVGNMLASQVTFGAGEANSTSFGTPEGLWYGSEALGGFLASYGSDGQLRWAREISDNWTQGPSLDVAVAADGSIAVVGTYQQSMTLGLGEPNETTLIGGQRLNEFGNPVYFDQLFIAKFASTGELLWAKDTQGGTSSGVGIDVLADGSAMVTGWFYGPGSYWWGTVENPPVAGAGEPNETLLTSSAVDGSFLIAKYAPDGTLQWARQAQHAPKPEWFPWLGAGAWGTDLCALADGSTVVTGVFEGLLTLGVGETNETLLSEEWDGSGFLARFDPSGALLWAKPLAGWRIGNVEALPDEGSLICGDSGGEFTLGAGEPNETTLGAGGFVASFRSDGSLSWAKQVPQGYNFVHPTLTQPLATFPDGSCIITTAGGVATVGAGEPNETALQPVPGSLILRLRGEVTALAASTQPAGSNFVTVEPTNDAEAGNSDVQLTFSGVLAAGTTSAIVSDGPPTPPLPANFALAGEPKWYEISTTASYTAPIEVCIDYDENGIADESALALMHYENGQWVEVTTSLDTLENRICGTTNSLSPFAVVVRPPVTIAAGATVISAFGGVTTLTVTTDGTVPWIATTAGTLLGNVAGSDRVFTQDLQAAPGVSGAWVTASIGSAATEPLFIRFVPVDPDLSTITISPGTTYQGGHATVTVTLRDDQGAPVGGVGPVVLGTNLGAFLGTVGNPAPGVFTQELAATQTGTAQITAAADGLALNATAALDVRDPALYGSVIGWNAAQVEFVYASVQAAVNRVEDDQLVRIFVTPGTYREVVKLADVHDLALEALSAYQPVTLQGFRLDRCQRVTLFGFDVDATASSAPGIALAGGQNGNDAIEIVDCDVYGAGANHAGIAVGPNHGALSISQCSVRDCAGNGIDLAQGGTFAISHSAVTGNGWNGVAVDKAASCLVRQCTIVGNGQAGDGRRGYGILRQRAPGAGNPAWITLIGNELGGNHGTPVPARSTAQLGNYDQVLDPSDGQSAY